MWCIIELLEMFYLVSLKGGENNMMLHVSRNLCYGIILKHLSVAASLEILLLHPFKVSLRYHHSTLSSSKRSCLWLLPPPLLPDLLLLTYPSYLFELIFYWHSHTFLVRLPIFSTLTHDIFFIFLKVIWCFQSLCFAKDLAFISHKQS